MLRERASMRGKHAVLAALAFFAAVIAIASVHKDVSSDEPVSALEVPRGAHHRTRRFGGVRTAQAMLRTGGLARVRETGALTASLTARKGMSLAGAEEVARTVATVQSLGCAAPGPDYGEVRRKAESNWWGAIKAFATADEVGTPDASPPPLFLALP